GAEVFYLTHAPDHGLSLGNDVFTGQRALYAVLIKNLILIIFSLVTGLTQLIVSLCLSQIIPLMERSKVLKA
ncbi:MAG: hypothetical protein MUP03_05615, partial [Anaerolineales bacterium]|nr:hypothetical protein [Anaerolineales bacterium]